jgi:hypothetical protein
MEVLMVSDSPILSEKQGGVLGRHELRRRVPSVAEMREIRAAVHRWTEAARRGETAPFSPGVAFDGEWQRWSPDVTGPKDFMAFGPHEWRSRIREVADLAVSRASVAVRLFELLHDRPPGTMTELAPEIVPEVPMDPYDGRPLDYAAGRDGWRVASRAWSEGVARTGDVEETMGPIELRFVRVAR